MKRAIFAFGLFCLIAAAGCVVFAGWTVHRGFSTRIRPGMVETELAQTMRAAAIPSRYRAMKNPVAITPEVLQEGMAHWADHCATCHGNNGNGDTMYGRTMYPRPPDMRQKNTQEMSDGELYYTIQNGVRLSGMSAFGTPGDSDLDSWKLVAFIRYLPSLSQTEELDMEKINPQSPQDLEEEQEEENFLNGKSAPSQPQPEHHHGKEKP